MKRVGRSLPSCNGLENWSLHCSWSHIFVPSRHRSCLLHFASFIWAKTFFTLHFSPFTSTSRLCVPVAGGVSQRRQAALHIYIYIYASACNINNRELRPLQRQVLVVVDTSTTSLISPSHPNAPAKIGAVTNTTRRWDDIAPNTNSTTLPLTTFVIFVVIAMWHTDLTKKTPNKLLATQTSPSTRCGASTQDIQLGSCWLGLFSLHYTPWGIWLKNIVCLFSKGVRAVVVFLFPSPFDFSPLSPEYVILQRRRPPPPWHHLPHMRHFTFYLAYSTKVPFRLNIMTIKVAMYFRLKYFIERTWYASPHIKWPSFSLRPITYFPPWIFYVTSKI